MREMQLEYGPRFFSGDGGVMMFAYRIDSTTEVGPRKATDADMLKYPEAYEAAKALPKRRGRPPNVSREAEVA